MHPLSWAFVCCRITTSRRWPQMRCIASRTFCSVMAGIPGLADLKLKWTGPGGVASNVDVGSNRIILRRPIAIRINQNGWEGEEKRTWYSDQIIRSHCPYEWPLLLALDVEASHNHNEKPSLACFLQWRTLETQLFQKHVQINFATCSNRHRKVTKKQKQSILHQMSSPHGDGGKRVGAEPYLLNDEMEKAKKCTVSLVLCSMCKILQIFCDSAKIFVDLMVVNSYHVQPGSTSWPSRSLRFNEDLRNVRYVFFTSTFQTP